jgi:transposase
MTIARKPYPSDVSDEEWSLVAPYLALMREDAVQRQHSLRELFNGLRYLIRYGIAWRAMPNDLPLGSRLSAGAALDGGRMP